MKRITSLFLIITVIMTMLVVGGVTTSAASTSQTITVTQTSMGKNGSVYVKWRTLPYCKYYRVFYKIENASWIKAADVHYTSQGSYYPGQTMYKYITVPMSNIHYGRVDDTVKIYVTVRGMDRDKKYNTSFRSYLASSRSLQNYAPQMYIASLDGSKATFTICDPSKINNSTKFRVFYRSSKGWKAIGDFNKNNLGNRFAVATLNVPLYKYNGVARFTVRGVNNKGQFTTPYLTDAVVENSPDFATYRWYKIIAG